MKLRDEALKILSKNYEPSAMITMRLGRHDMAFRTDELGRPMLLFFGRADRTGRIKGERFARLIATDARGRVLKDFWDNKGKTQ